MRKNTPFSFAILLLGFLALAFNATAEVSMSDIWRWGLVRKTDMLPVGGSLTYPTNGVIRVIETVSVVDSNRVVCTVLTNLNYDASGAAMAAGTYVSATRELTTFYFSDSGWSFNNSTPMWLMPADLSCTFESTNSVGVLPAVLVPAFPLDPSPTGYAVIDWYRYTLVTTNDFVCVDRLQDAIDDLRLEISEAIEAHVQLLHP